jgi:hypothetical protein
LAAYQLYAFTTAAKHFGEVILSVVILSVAIDHHQLSSSPNKE